MNPLTYIDRLLNSLTMYAVVQNALRILAAIALIFSFTGVLTLPPLGLILSFSVLMATTFAVNWLLARLYRIPANTESYAITGLILFCIMPPVASVSDALLLALAATLAMASKYILTYSRRHIFNPAAIAAVIMLLLGLTPATWWIGAGVMLPFTAALGLLIIRKIRRFGLTLSFLAAAVAVTALLALRDGQPLMALLIPLVASSPLVFLGAVMLTEPSTMPPTNRLRLAYGALVGALFAGQLHLGPVFITPEIALIIGNLLSFAVSPHKHRYQLRLVRKTELAPHIFDFAFTPDRPLTHQPGQYMEWTLPLAGRADLRGNRRTFTIASSPTEPEVHLGVKFYDPASRFKSTLAALPVGATLEAGSIAGDFTLPADPRQKLVFIAGGIGITPFRSLIQYLRDRKDQRDIVLIYAATNAGELVYRDILEAPGVKFIPVTGAPLTADAIKSAVPDLAERQFYLSGPNAMVNAYRRLLRGLGVAGHRIKTDYFAGY